MRTRRQARSQLMGVRGIEAPEAHGGSGPEPACGVELTFRPDTLRLGTDRVLDFAPLGPADSVEAALGLARILRLLRAARIAVPEPKALLGDPAGAARLLERALGTRVVLELQERSSVRFTAWTEHGVETHEDVVDVLEDESAWLVVRRGARLPVRVPRDRVVRQRTECETWFEVTGIERLGPR